MSDNQNNYLSGGGGGSKKNEPNPYTKVPSSYEVGGDGGVSKEDGKYVVFVSSEGDEFSLPLRIASLSNLVTKSQEIDEGNEDGSMSGNEDEPSSVFRFELNIPSEYLSEIVEFMKFYDANPMPEIKKPINTYEKYFKDLQFEFYQNFSKKELSDMFELMNFANFMDIKPLLDLMCARVACLGSLNENDLRDILKIDPSVPRIDDEIEFELEGEIEEEIDGVVVKKTVKQTVKCTAGDKVLEDNKWIEDNV